MADIKKYLDLAGLNYYDEKIKELIKSSDNELAIAIAKLENQLPKGKLYFGNYVFDGTTDIHVAIYDGEIK